MRLSHFAVLAAAALGGAAAAIKDATNFPSDDEFTLQPGQKLVPHDPNDINPEYPPEVYEQLYPQFLEQEMVRKEADYADDEHIVLLGAILSAEDDGNVKKANLLRRIKAWKEQSGQLHRRSLDDTGDAPDADDADDGDDSGDETDDNSPDDEKNDDDNEPTTEDVAWVAAFVSGEPVDPNMLWSTAALTDDTADDAVADIADENPSVYMATLARAHTHNAIAYARYRARAAADSTATLDQGDADWASAFLNGEYVDQNMIFNASDLDVPAPDDPAQLADLDAALPAATDLSSAGASAESSTAAALDKRYKHPPRNALQVLNRFLRAGRRARRRAIRKDRQAVRHRKHLLAHAKHLEHEAHRKHHHHHHHWSSPLGNGKPLKHGIPNIAHHPVHHHKKHCYRFNPYYMCPVICAQQWWGFGQNAQCLHLVKGGG